MKELFTNLTGIEWAVVLIATAVCLLGAVLPMLGEDPLLARWKQARKDRRTATIAARQAKREAKKSAKAARAAALPKSTPH